WPYNHQGARRLPFGRPRRRWRRAVALLQRLQDELKDAMRRGDPVRRDTIRLLIAALKAERQALVAAEWEKNPLSRLREADPAEADRASSHEAGGGGLSDTLKAQLADIAPIERELGAEEEQAVLQREVKRRRDAIEAFRNA